MPLKLEISELDSASNTQVLDAYDYAREMVSHYNAAEGNWRLEKPARKKAEAYMARVASELHQRGLSARVGNYLL